MACKVLILYLISAVLFCSADGVFEEVPVDTTCTLGQTFTIRCSPPLTSGTARWVFGGERLSITYPPDGVTPQSLNNDFTLRITCTLARHYVSVQCIAVTVTDIRANPPVIEEEESPPVLIRVSGLPDRVETISVTTDAASIPVVWERPPPSALNATFCVTVYDTTTDGSACNANMESFEQCMLPDTRFTFTPSLANAEAPNYVVYGFVVTAASALGQGPPSRCVFANFTHTVAVSEQQANWLEGSGSPSPPTTTGGPATTTGGPATTTGLAGNDSSPSPLLVASQARESEDRWLLTVIIVVTAVVALLACMIFVVVLVILGVFFLRKRKDSLRNKTKDITVTMTKCGAYECPDNVFNGTIRYIGAPKEFTSYESLEHIYAEIGKTQGI